MKKNQLEASEIKKKEALLHYLREETCNSRLLFLSLAS